MEIKKLFNLKGKTALITGGSQGIGKAISMALAENGADIVINYRSNKELALQTEKEIKGMGVNCHLFAYDIAQVDSVEKIYSFLQEKGIEVDILVLDASLQIRNSWDQVTSEEFENQINTNFRASLFLIQKLYPLMKKKKWGRILTIGSVQQKRPHPQMIVYAASKMAQLSMVKSLAPQFAPYNVTINNLAPGAILTARNDEVLKDEKYKKLTEAKIPAGYLGEASDCASTALLFCSDAGRYVTGQNIFVGGGMSLNF